MWIDAVEHKNFGQRGHVTAIRPGRAKLLMARLWLKAGVPEKALEMMAPYPGSNEIGTYARAMIDNRYRGLAASEALLGNLHAAEGLLVQSIQSGTAGKWTYLWLARYRSRRYQNAAAMESLDQALALDATFPQAVALRATLARAEDLLTE